MFISTEFHVNEPRASSGGEPGAIEETALESTEPRASQGATRANAKPLYGEPLMLLFGDAFCACGAQNPALVVYGPDRAVVSCQTCVPGLRVRPAPVRTNERRRVDSIEVTEAGDATIVCGELAIELRRDSPEHRRLTGDATIANEVLEGLEVPILVETIDGWVQSAQLDLDALAKDLRSTLTPEVAADAGVCMCGARIDRRMQVQRHARLRRVVGCPRCAGLADAVPWDQGAVLECVDRTEDGLAIVVAGARHEFDLAGADHVPLAVHVLAKAANEDVDSVTSGWRDGANNRLLDRFVERLRTYAGTALPINMEAATKEFVAEAAKGRAAVAHHRGTCRCGATVPEGGWIRLHHPLGVVGCVVCDSAIGRELAVSTSLQSIDGLLVPAGYEVWSDGVFRVRFQKEDEDDDDDDDEGRGSAQEIDAEYTQPPADAHTMPVPPARRKFLRRVVPRAIWIAGRSVPLDDITTQQLRLVLVDDGGRQSVRTVPRDLIARHRTLVELSAYGYPVTDLNAKRLLMYLAAWLETNGSKLPAPLLVRRYGAFERDGKVAWRIGKETIGPKDLVVDLVAPEQNRYTAALIANGTMAAWLDIARAYTAQPHPLVRLALGAAVAPTLLRLFGLRSFCVHLWGNTESSKTAVWALATSVWGAPNILVSNLNRTQISGTETFREMTDLPLVYDEKELIDGEKGIDLRRLIYEVCSEQGRGRANEKGGLAWSPTWKTLLLTTGEDPITGTGKRQDLGGMANRLLEVHVDQPIMEKADGARLHTLTDYGWAGPAFLRALLPFTNERLQVLKTAFCTFRSDLAARAQREDTAVTQAAVLGFGQYLFTHWILETQREAAREQALRDALWILSSVAKSTEEDRRPVWERAIEAMQQHAVSNPDRYATPAEYADSLVPRDKDDPRPRMLRSPLTAFVVKDKLEVWWNPPELERVLRDAGLSPRRVFADLKAQGKLTGERPNANKDRRQHANIADGRRQSYYVTKIDVLGES